jgi:hypothetical protein
MKMHQLFVFHGNMMHMNLFVVQVQPTIFLAVSNLANILSVIPSLKHVCCVIILSKMVPVAPKLSSYL